jgi:hypothetical protein
VVVKCSAHLSKEIRREEDGRDKKSEGGNRAKLGKENEVRKYRHTGQEVAHLSSYLL